jgi:hypothetical protein
VAQVGFAMGFRPHAGFLDWLAAFDDLGEGALTIF